MRMHRLVFAVATSASIALVATGTGCAKNEPTATSPATTATTAAVKEPGTTAPAATVTTASGSGASVPGTATAPNQVTIVDFLFEPSDLAVTAGTEVVWKNGDGFDHWVLADDKTSFDSGRLAEGATYAHRFMTPGTFSYFCDIHNQMKGTIVVS